MKSVLIIGQDGQVSGYLQRVLTGNYDVIAAQRELIDLSKLDEIKSILATLNPSLIINPAAYTAVDLAEQEAESAFRINRDAVKEIAEYCAESNTPLIHFSTDYVFDGNALEPYIESDLPAPTGVYGQSKLEGDYAVLEAAAPALILRTSWVYSNRGKNFYKTMLKLAQSKDELSVVADQMGAPTYAGSIAQACSSLVEQIFTQGGIHPDQIGVYHFTCQGQTSWAEFAEAIFIANKCKQIRVNPIATVDYPTPAARPAYSVLSGAKLLATFAIALPDWRDALAQCVAETERAGVSAYATEINSPLTNSNAAGS